MQNRLLSLKVKIFADGADKPGMFNLYANPLIKGLTTNPTLMRAAGITDYESFKSNQDEELSDLAWLFNMNRGIFMTPGREEEWTLSVTHTDESVDRYVAVFEEMAAELTT